MSKFPQETTKIENFVNRILSLIGLFVPVKFIKDLEPRWKLSISISGIPIGIIMIVVAVIVNLLMN